MPILTVEIVLRERETLAPGLARSLAVKAGEVFESSPGRTWVRLSALPAQQYAEDGEFTAGAVAPVFVTVVKALVPDPETMQREAARLAEEFAPLCGRPAENIHITYEPPALGRIAFGGKLLSG